MYHGVTFSSAGAIRMWSFAVPVEFGTILW